MKRTSKSSRWASRAWMALMRRSARTTCGEVNLRTRSRDGRRARCGSHRRLRACECRRRRWKPGHSGRYSRRSVGLYVALSSYKPVKAFALTERESVATRIGSGTRPGVGAKAQQSTKRVNVAVDAIGMEGQSGSGSQRCGAISVLMPHPPGKRRRGREAKYGVDAIAELSARSSHRRREQSAQKTRSSLS